MKLWMLFPIFLVLFAVVGAIAGTILKIVFKKNGKQLIGNGEEKYYELFYVFIFEYFPKFKNLIIENKITDKQELKFEINKMIKILIDKDPDIENKDFVISCFWYRLYSSDEYTELVELLKQQNKEKNKNE